MLQLLSDGAKGGISKFILVGFMFMAVVGLVLTDVGGFFRDGVSSNDVAKIGDESIGIREFDNVVRRTLTQQGFTDVQQAYKLGLIDQILNGYARDIMIEQQARAYGIRIGREQVAAQIHKYVEPLVRDGVNPQQALDQLLSNQGITEADLADSVRITMANGLVIQSLISGGEILPPPLVRHLARLAKETRDVEIITLSPADLKLDKPLTEDEIKDFYELTKAEYATPEMRGFTVAILAPESFAETIEITDEEMKSYYDDNIDSYTKPETRRIEQLVFGSEDDAKAFVASEKPVFNDHVKGAQYRAAQEFQASALPAELAEPVFALESGKTSPPLKTPFGWHVVKLDEIIEPKTETFDEVKKDITILLTQEKEGDLLFEAVETIDQQVEEGTDLKTLVDTYKMETVTLGPVDRVGMTSDKKTGMKTFEEDAGSLLDTAFTLNEGERSAVLEMKNGHFALIQVDSITPQEFKSLADVRQNLETRLSDMKKSQLNQKRAEEILGRVKSGAANLNAVAKEMGLPLKTLSDVKRVYDGDMPAPLDQQSHGTLFSNEVGTVQTAQQQDAILVMRSFDQVIPKEADAATIEQIETAMKRMQPGEIMESFGNGARTRYQMTINRTLLDQMYAGGVEQQP